MTQKPTGRTVTSSRNEIMTPRKALEGLEDLALPAATRAAFLGGNAARVFGL